MELCVCVCVCVCAHMHARMLVSQSCLTLCDPMDYTVMESPRLEYWSGKPFPSPGDLPNPGI